LEIREKNYGTGYSGQYLPCYILPTNPSDLMNDWAKRNAKTKMIGCECVACVFCVDLFAIPTHYKRFTKK
jgi:hypothetical protein